MQEKKENDSISKLKSTNSFKKPNTQLVEIEEEQHRDVDEDDYLKDKKFLKHEKKPEPLQLNKHKDQNKNNLCIEKCTKQAPIASPEVSSSISLSNSSGSKTVLDDFELANENKYFY